VCYICSVLDKTQGLDRVLIDDSEKCLISKNPVFLIPLVLLIVSLTLAVQPSLFVQQRLSGHSTIAIPSEKARSIMLHRKEQNRSHPAKTLRPDPNSQLPATSGNPNIFFSTPLYASGGIDPNGVTTADLNRDGKLDLVVANAYADGGVYQWRSQSTLWQWGWHISVRS